MLSTSLCCTLLLLLCLIAVLLVCSFRRRRREEPPLHQGWIPFLGLALEYAKNPLNFLRSMQALHGDVFTCKIAGKFYTFVTDPFSYSSVARQAKHLDFQQFAIGVSQKVFGHADFTDPVYRGKYKDIHSLFHQTLQGPSLQPLICSMKENLEAVIQRDAASQWASQGLGSFVDRIMFEAGYLTLFGREPDAPAGGVAVLMLMQRVIADFHTFDHAFPHMAAGLPVRLFLKAFRARESLVEKLQHTRLKRNTRLSALIERRIQVFDQMEQLDERGKARTHVAMLWASQANTLPATFWSIYYMLRSPEALRAAHTEVATVLREAGHQPDSQEKLPALSREQLDRMCVLGSIIEEALRLSSASIMIRVAKENFILNLDTGKTVAIRKGDYVAAFPPLMHMDPEIYDNPTQFRFDRFLDANQQRKSDFYKDGRRLRHYLLPFGLGISECPGRFFAMCEIKQFLLLVLHYYQLELQEDAELPPLAADCTRAGLGILPPQQDVTLRYRRRGTGVLL